MGLAGGETPIGDGVEDREAEREDTLAFSGGEAVQVRRGEVASLELGVVHDAQVQGIGWS